jgi:hypothetical protein
MIRGNANEIYSPEVTKDDFLEFSRDMPGRLVKLARDSGFRVKSSDGSQDISPRVVMGKGNGQCPNVQQALQAAAKRRDERRRNIQSKLYRVGFDDVTPPRVVSSPQPEAGRATSGRAGSANPTGAKPTFKAPSSFWRSSTLTEASPR